MLKMKYLKPSLKPRANKPVAHCRTFASINAYKLQQNQSNAVEVTENCIQKNYRL